MKENTVKSRNIVMLLLLAFAVCTMPLEGQGGDPNYKPKRLNKMIELLEAGQPVYDLSVSGVGYEEGKKLAQERYDLIQYQMEHGPFLQKRIRAGSVKQQIARTLEVRCLDLLRGYDSGQVHVDTVVSALDEYEALHSPGKSFGTTNRQTLEAMPWKECQCDVCRKLGVNVVLFRGAERNRRRGFHNLWVFYRQLQHSISSLPLVCDVGETLDVEFEMDATDPVGSTYEGK
jgi:hypothetical protein